MEFGVQIYLRPRPWLILDPVHNIAHMAMSYNFVNLLRLPNSKFEKNSILKNSEWIITLTLTDLLPSAQMWTGSLKKILLVEDLMQFPLLLAEEEAHNTGFLILFATILNLHFPFSFFNCVWFGFHITLLCISLFTTNNSNVCF